MVKGAIKFLLSHLLLLDKKLFSIAFCSAQSSLLVYMGFVHLAPTLATLQPLFATLLDIPPICSPSCKSEVCREVAQIHLCLHKKMHKSIFASSARKHTTKDLQTGDQICPSLYLQSCKSPFLLVSAYIFNHFSSFFS